MTYRVAVIGSGTMGSVHAGQWKAVPNVQVVGVLALTKEETSHIARPLDCPGFGADEFDTLIRETRPDIVDVCVPTPVHRHYIEKAADASKAVFVEKPLARTLSDCDAIVEKVEKTGIPLMAGHVLRYFPEYAAARRLVHSGGVGKPATIRTARLAGMPHLDKPQSWYRDPEQSGGVVLDMLIHDFDWLLWTLGPVTRVFAKGLSASPEHTGTRDYALATLRFASGAVGHVTGSWAHPGGFRTSLEVAGDAGMIDHDSTRSAPLTVSLSASAEGAGGVAVPESPTAPSDDPYFQELAAFIKALETGTTPPVTVYDAREATRLALAVISSIQSGKVVQL